MNRTETDKCRAQADLGLDITSGRIRCGWCGGLVGGGRQGPLRGVARWGVWVWLIQQRSAKRVLCRRKKIERGTEG